MNILLIILIVLVYMVGFTLAEISSKDDKIIDNKDEYTLYATTLAHLLDIVLWPLIILLNIFRYIYLIGKSIVKVIKNRK